MLDCVACRGVGSSVAHQSGDCGRGFKSRRPDQIPLPKQAPRAESVSGLGGNLGERTRAVQDYHRCLRQRARGADRQVPPPARAAAWINRGSPGAAASMSSPLPPRPGDASPRCRCSPVGPAQEPRAGRAPTPFSVQAVVAAVAARESSSSWPQAGPACFCPARPASFRRKSSTRSRRPARCSSPISAAPHSRAPGSTTGMHRRRRLSTPSATACDPAHTRPSRSRSRLPSGRIAQAVGLA